MFFLNYYHKNITEISYLILVFLISLELVYIYSTFYDQEVSILYILTRVKEKKLTTKKGFPNMMHETIKNTGNVLNSSRKRKPKSISDTPKFHFFSTQKFDVIPVSHQSHSVNRVV